MLIILLGAPGSGKGTQATRISKKVGIPHISTGDLFRENLKNETDLGKEVKKYLNSGQLVPDEIVIAMLKDRIAQADCKSGYLLDGFPRTIHQAEVLDKELGDAVGLHVINLQVSDDLIIKRIEGRRSCGQCGAIYNVYFSKPKVEGHCDKCEGALNQRADDNGEIVKERLRVYHLQTAPLEAYYEQKGLLVNIDGEQDSDKVFEEIMKELN